MGKKSPKSRCWGCLCRSNRVGGFVWCINYCGAFVGAAAGFGGYAARYAGVRRRNWKRVGIENALAWLADTAMGTAARCAGGRLSSMRGPGFRFSAGKTARGADFVWKRTRKFGFHSHGVPGQSCWRVLHYHRRPGIGRHRPGRVSR